jgi:ribosomal protein S27AE
MADKWYFAKGETKLGPYSSAQLKELADNGKILPSDTVWKEGIEKGVLAAKVKYLFSVPPGKVPPSPAAKVVASPPSLAPPAEPAANGGTRSERTAPASESNEETETDQPISDAPSEVEKMETGPVAADSESTGTEANQKAAAEASSPAAPAEPQRPETKKSPAQPAGTLPKSTRSFRVTGSRGAIVLGSDGTFVRYRKKCPKCGTEDSSVRTLQVRSGINRDRYFCQKCKKLQQVEIHGTL